MNVLILGSGGREHAFAYKIRQSLLCKNLYVAPGNSGTSKIASNLEIQVNQFEQIAEAIKNLNVSLVVVGPEVPLVNGLTDFIKSNNDLKDTIVIGPNKHAAQLEGSKDFAKDFLNRHNIPTASHQTFTAENINDAFFYIDEMKAPYVLKADGLAAGKGVLIIDNPDEAKNEIHEMLINSKFGDASKSVVVEEFLDGIELSCFVITDGQDYKLLPSAKDYKRIGEGDTGLNTGGMGAYSPSGLINETLERKIIEKIILPTLIAIKEMGEKYKGFLYAGLMISDNEPFLIEYNVRMGDPECQTILPLLKTDLIDIFNACCDGTLENLNIEWEEKKSLCIVLCSKGYPEKFINNVKIDNINNLKLNNNDFISVSYTHLTLPTKA